MTTDPSDPRPWNQRRKSGLRRTPMRRAGADRRQRIEPGKRRRPPAERGEFSPKVRKAIRARDCDRCVRCGTHIDQGTLGHSIQHRYARGAGGTSQTWVGGVANGIVLCGTGSMGCHGWVEAHPEASLPLGWRIETGEAPELVPVLYAHLGHVLLLDEYAGVTRLAEVPRGQFEGMRPPVTDVRLFMPAA